MLLYSIINAVTDPILLTDTEGKLIIANSHAEKLFAAPEEASEGWRRAVALNNMLFSAALSTSAVGHGGARPPRAAAGRSAGRVRSAVRAAQLAAPRTSGRAPTWCRFCATSPTWRRAKEEIEESYRTLRVAQAEIRAERDRLDLIIDSVADPILVTDQEGDIVLMNTPAERLFNAPRIRRRVGAAQRSRQRRGPDIVRLERADAIGRAALSRRNPAVRSGQRPAAAGGGDRRHDPLRAGRVDVGRDHPPRPDRGDREGAGSTSS